MGACASKRTKANHVEELEQKYAVLTSLFATRAEDLANIVSEFEASKKAEARAYEDAEELREQVAQLEAKLLDAEEARVWEIRELRIEMERREEEILAYQRVVDMRTQERDQARDAMERLRPGLRRLSQLHKTT